MSYDGETTIIEGKVKRETDMAILIQVDGEPDNEVWLPKSQIEWESSGGIYSIGDELEIEIPQWLAEQKGLI
jgi:hypothetical protein